MEEYSKDKEAGDNIACPLCREEFKIPQNGVKGLPKNFWIEQLKDIVDGPGGSEKAGERKASKTFEMKVFCEQHKKNVLDMYCLDCKIPICSLCIKFHKKHECLNVDDVANEYKKQMTSDMKRMVGSLEQCRELMKKQKKRKTEFIDEVDKVEREICEQVERMKQRIDREKQTLMKELEVFKRDRVKLIDRMVGETEQHAAFIESLMKYTEELRSKGTVGDVTQQTSSLHNRAEELMRLDAIQQAMDDIRSLDVSFTATTPQPSGENSVGKVNIREQQRPPFRRPSPFDIQQLQKPELGEKWKIK
jgi:hypothetical protein